MFCRQMHAPRGRQGRRTQQQPGDVPPDETAEHPGGPVYQRAKQARGCPPLHPTFVRCVFVFLFLLCCKRVQLRSRGALYDKMVQMAREHGRCTQYPEASTASAKAYCCCRLPCAPYRVLLPLAVCCLCTLAVCCLCTLALSTLIFYIIFTCMQVAATSSSPRRTGSRP